MKYDLGTEVKFYSQIRARTVYGKVVGHSSAVTGPNPRAAYTVEECNGGAQLYHEVDESLLFEIKPVNRGAAIWSPDPMLDRILSSASSEPIKSNKCDCGLHGVDPNRMVGHSSWCDFGGMQ